MTQSPEITPARPADLPTLLRLIRALCAYHGDETDVTLEHLQQRFFAPGHAATALVARSGLDIIGYAAITEHTALHETAPRIDVHHLYIVETERGKGIGKALIAAARDHARAKGARKLTIGTDPNNASAIAAYRAMQMLSEIVTPGPRFVVDLDAP